MLLGTRRGCAQQLLLRRQRQSLSDPAERVLSAEAGAAAEQFSGSAVRGLPVQDVPAEQKLAHKRALRSADVLRLVPLAGEDATHPNLVGHKPAIQGGVRPLMILYFYFLLLGSLAEQVLAVHIQQVGLLGLVVESLVLQQLPLD